MTRKLFGNEKHPVYSRYRAIMGRCRNHAHASFKHYGGRGIDISDCLTPFAAFRDYVVSLPGYDPQNKTIDRIDNNLGYVRGNLRWTSKSVQTANQRFSGKGKNTYTGVNWSKSHNKWVARITHEGKTLMSNTFETELEALDARNSFILKHGLPHTIQKRATTIPTGSTLQAIGSGSGQHPEMDEDIVSSV